MGAQIPDRKGSAGTAYSILRSVQLRGFTATGTPPAGKKRDWEERDSNTER